MNNPTLKNQFFWKIFAGAVKPAARMLAAIVSVAALAGCAGPQPSTSASLQALCDQRDLSTINQRQLLAGGYYAIANKNLVCAERLTSKARELDANDPYAALNLGAIYQRTNRHELAKTEYEKAIELDGSANSDAEQAVESTAEEAKNKRPRDIARRNLAMLKK